MKSLPEKIRSLFSELGPKLKTLGSKLKRKPKVEPAAQNDAAPAVKRKVDRFTLVSWAATAFIVVVLLVSTVLYKNANPPSQNPPQATIEPGIETPAVVEAPVIGTDGNGSSFILRDLQLKTNIPERPRYKSLVYRVSRGDAMLSIAEEFKIKYESILYVNTELEDNPHNLKPGMELLIPPVDGLYYEWKEEDKASFHGITVSGER